MEKYKNLTAAQAVAALDALSSDDDPETAHAEADEILRALAPVTVNRAYERLVKRASWWAWA